MWKSCKSSLRIFSDLAKTTIFFIPHKSTSAISHRHGPGGVGFNNNVKQKRFFWVTTYALDIGSV